MQEFTEMCLIIENAIFCIGWVSKMPFCCIGVSKMHLFVQGVSKMPFCSIGHRC